MGIKTSLKKALGWKPRKTISELAGIMTIFLVAVLAGQLYVAMPAGTITPERLVGMSVLAAATYIFSVLILGAGKWGK